MCQTNIDVDTPSCSDSSKVSRTYRACYSFEISQSTCALQSVRVCMIDTGTDLTHPDIMSNLWVNEAELNGKAGVDDDNNGEHAVPCWASLCQSHCLQVGQCSAGWHLLTTAGLQSAASPHGASSIGEAGSPAGGFYRVANSCFTLHGWGVVSRTCTALQTYLQEQSI